MVFLVFACCDFAMVSYGSFWYWLGGWVVVGFGLGLRFEFVGFVVFGLELVLRYFR